MSLERDHTHATRSGDASPGHDDVAPGRASRSAQLRAPEHPLESGLLASLEPEPTQRSAEPLASGLQAPGTASPMQSTAKRSISAPSKLDLGVTNLGDTSSHRVVVSADGGGNGRSGPRVDPKVSGVPALKVKRAPFSLFANETVYVPDRDDLQLELRPWQEGPFSGTLDLGVTAAGYDNVEIPIVGMARRIAPPPLEPLPPRVDIGEQIVGSEHWFTVATLTPARAGMNAIVYQSIRRPAPSGNAPGPLPLDVSAGLTTDEFPLKLDAGLSLRVHFKPTRTGAYRADLFVAVEWTNGEFVHRTIAVSGKARGLQEAPAQPVEPEPAKRPGMAPSGERIEPTGTEVGEFMGETNGAAAAAELLADKQRDGLKGAEDDIMRAKKAVPEPSLFARFAELAITMAVGGIAQVVSKEIGRLVVAAKDSPQIADGLNAAIKDGLKANAKRVIAGSSNSNGSDSDSSAASTEAGDRKHESRDPVNRFFARQRTLITALKNENTQLVRNQEDLLLPVLGAERERVRQIFRELKASFVASHADAEGEQTRATVSQWVVALAQQTLGKTRVTRDGRAVGRGTNISPRYSVDRKGLLQLYTTLDGWIVDPASLRVDRAELSGVSDTAAARLGQQAILTLGIPVRIIVKSAAGTAFISRDELGRVKIEGTLPDHANEHRGKDVAVQRNRDATRICDHLLSKPLEDSGIVIKTDTKGNMELGS